MSIVIVREEKKANGNNDTDGFPVWLIIMVLVIAVMAIVVVQRFVLKRE
jgi:hypothetical protein